jgi:hypothetical protein
MVIAIAIVAGIWFFGGCNLWRLQNRSRPTVQVGWRDRVFALFWLPISLWLFIASLPFLIPDLIKRRRKIRGRRIARRRRERSHVILPTQPLQHGKTSWPPPAPRSEKSALTVACHTPASGDTLFTIRSPAGRQR